ncbi:uncharacterized protein LOC101756407 isoform X3 [Setaria italica]|nr:uncharacterized protein LOC101756407 isoform X3 [Setaria italica]
MLDLKETKNKGPVDKIELWDEAHKKKDGNYENQSVLQLMDKAYEKLADLKTKKNGNLSSQDYDKVFEDVIGKDSTVGGYYDEKYWTTAQFYQGSSSVRQSASEVRVQNELQAVRQDLRIVTELAKRMHAFIARKYPEEDWTNEMANISNIAGYGPGQEVEHAEQSMSNFQTSGNDSQRTRVAYHAKSKRHLVNSSSSHEQRIQKVSNRNELPKETTLQEVHTPDTVGNSAVQYQVENNGVSGTVRNNQKRVYATSHTEAKEPRVNSSSAHEQRNVKVSKTKQMAKQQNSDKRAVVLLSTNIRAQGLVVAKGSLVSRDSTYVVGEICLARSSMELPLKMFLNLGMKGYLDHMETFRRLRMLLDIVLLGLLLMLRELSRPDL